MGTRNLTMVINKGDIKVAQYGQWDGYPEGQGATILEFIKKTDLGEFEKKLNKCRFIDSRKQKSINKWLETIGVNDGWMTVDQAEKYHEKYPLLTRDNGAEILQLIMECEDKIIWLHDSTDFAYDSLFCEWAYIIDMDKKVLEVYRGFNKGEIDPKSRFNKKIGDNEYGPITLLVSYSFDDLERMSKDDFAKNTNKLAYADEIEEE